MLRATTACTFSCLIWPAGSAAYFSTLRSHKSLEKHSESRLSYLFAHLPLLSSDLFSSDSFHLCFSTVHIVGSFTSKLPSIILSYNNQTISDRTTKSHMRHFSCACAALFEAFLLGDNNPCLTGEWHECSMHGIEHVHWNWRDASAGHLWQDVVYMIWKNRMKSDRSIFDELMEFTVSRATEKLSPVFPKAEVYS